MQDYIDWTREQFEALPHRGWQEDIGEIQAIVILPMAELHDSGFKCMDFIAIQKGVPTYRLAGGSDIIHFDGIGGYGQNWFKNNRAIPQSVSPKDWNIDCLPVSGLLRIFGGKHLIVGNALSSFELYNIK